jgi:acetyl esterase/lipase
MAMACCCPQQWWTVRSDGGEQGRRCYKRYVVNSWTLTCMRAAAARSACYHTDGMAGMRRMSTLPAAEAALRWLTPSRSNAASMRQHDERQCTSFKQGISSTRWQGLPTVLLAGYTSQAFTRKGRSRKEFLSQSSGKCTVRECGKGLHGIASMAMRSPRSRHYKCMSAGNGAFATHEAHRWAQQRLASSRLCCRSARPSIGI